MGANVKVELYKGGALNRKMTSSTANDGSYAWTVPSNQALGADYKIKITSTSNTAQSDYSDEYFAIANPKVTYPTATAVTWKRGSSYTIKWSGYVGAGVKILLYKGGVLNLTITSSTANDGSQAWTVPTGQALGSDYKIKITSTSSAAQYDWSDNYFTIAQ